MAPAAWDALQLGHPAFHPSGAAVEKEASMLPVNRELWGLLKGRVLQAFASSSGGVLLRFGDDSMMHVNTPQTPCDSDIESVRGCAVAQVRQHDTNLVLTSESGKQLLLHTTKPSGSVLVRDGAGRLEYGD